MAGLLAPAPHEAPNLPRLRSEVHRGVPRLQVGRDGHRAVSPKRLGAILNQLLDDPVSRPVPRPLGGHAHDLDQRGRAGLDQSVLRLGDVAEVLGRKTEGGGGLALATTYY